MQPPAVPEDSAPTPEAQKRREPVEAVPGSAAAAVEQPHKPQPEARAADSMLPQPPRESEPAARIAAPQDTPDAPADAQRIVVRTASNHPEQDLRVVFGLKLTEKPAAAVQPPPLAHRPAQDTAAPRDAAQAPERAVEAPRAAMRPQLHTGFAQPQPQAPERKQAAARPSSRWDVTSFTAIPNAAREALTATPQQATRAAAPAAPPEIPNLEPPRAHVLEPLREVSLVVPGDKAERVEVRLAERAGQLHVAVRTNDAGLTQSLQEHVGDLVTWLEQTGFRTESWQPVAQAAVDAGAAAQSQGDAASHEQGESRHHHPGNGSDHSQQHRRGRDESRPQWLQALQGSLSRKESSSWLPQ
jgi:hypothetical protein